MFTFWAAVHYITGLGGTLLSTAVAVKTGVFADRTLSIMALLAAACVGSLALLTPNTKAKLYHAAWTHLESLYCSYRYTDDISLSQLFAAKHEAELMIQGIFGDETRQTKVA
jgi:hypothetical protein